MVEIPQRPIPSEFPRPERPSFPRPDYPPRPYLLQSEACHVGE